MSKVPSELPRYGDQLIHHIQSHRQTRSLVEIHFITQKLPDYLHVHIYRELHPKGCIFTVFRFPSFDAYWDLYVWIIPVLQVAFFLVVLALLKSGDSTIGRLIGLQRRLLLRDIGLGFALYLAGFGIIIGYMLLWSILQPTLAAPRISLESAHFTIIVGSLTAAICEESIWRGYGISRLERLTGSSTKAAVTISSLAFAVWHVWNPVFSVPYNFLVGLLYSYVFLRLRRLFPLIFGHWLMT